MKYDPNIPTSYEELIESFYLEDELDELIEDDDDCFYLEDLD